MVICDIWRSHAQNTTQSRCQLCKSSRQPNVLDHKNMIMKWTTQSVFVFAISDCSNFHRKYHVGKIGDVFDQTCGAAGRHRYGGHLDADSQRIRIKMPSVTGFRRRKSGQKHSIAFRQNSTHLSTHMFFYYYVRELHVMYTMSIHRSLYIAYLSARSRTEASCRRLLVDK